MHRVTVAAVLIVGACLSCAQSLSPGGPIGPSSGNARGPQLVITASRVHVIFSYAPQVDVPPQVFIVSSSNGGKDFSNSRQIAATGGSSTTPAVVASPRTGTLYVAWAEADVQQETSRIFFAKSTDFDKGSSFASPLTVSASGIAVAPRIALDSDENIYLVWESGGDTILQRQVFFARSSDFGISFTPEKALSDVGAAVPSHTSLRSHTLYVL